MEEDCLSEPLDNNEEEDQSEDRVDVSETILGHCGFGVEEYEHHFDAFLEERDPGRQLGPRHHLVGLRQTHVLAEVNDKQAVDQDIDSPVQHHNEVLACVAEIVGVRVAGIYSEDERGDGHLQGLEVGEEEEAGGLGDVAAVAGQRYRAPYMTPSKFNKDFHFKSVQFLGLLQGSSSRTEL